VTAFVSAVGEALARQALALAGKVPVVIEAVVVLVLFWLGARLVRGSLRRVLARTSTEGHVDLVVARLAYVGVMALGIVTGLGMLGVSVAALVTGLGLAGFALGFAFKDILGNFLAGIMLLFQRPFTLGDQVRIDSVEGTVENIRVRDTVLRAPDGTLAYLPNEKVFTATIVNVSSPSVRRAEVVVSVDSSADLALAVRTAADTLAGHEAALDEPAPDVLVTALADGAVRLACRFWVDTTTRSFARAESDVTGALKAAMDEAGVALK
jgi:small-conductance mechanosensitive channel